MAANLSAGTRLRNVHDDLVADSPRIADAHVRFGQSFNGEVLAEGAGGQCSVVHLLPPTSKVLD
jgi:hypothetical protein